MSTWSSSSLLSVPTKRSATAFMLGAHGAVRTTDAPAPSEAPWLVDVRPRGRDRHRQKSRNPNRCQRSTVSGWINVTTGRPVDVASTPMIHRCMGDQRTRLPRRRHFAATTCYRRISFSATRTAREPSMPNTNRQQAPSIPTSLSGEGRSVQPALAAQQRRGWRK